MRNRFGDDEEINPVEELRFKAEIKNSLSDANASRALQAIQQIRKGVFQADALKFIVFGRGEDSARIEVEAPADIAEYVRGQVRSIGLPLDVKVVLDQAELKSAPLLQGTLFEDNGD